MKTFYSMKCLILFIVINCWGQGENNYWYFGTGIGLNFQNGATTTNPSILTNGSNFYTNSNLDNGNSGSFATVSDSFGNLLFYSDGNRIYNKLHQVMSGSPTFSNSNLVGLYAGSNQSIIIPDSNNSKKYYLFSTGSQIIVSNYQQFNYTMTTIDFNSNPLGEVTNHLTNILNSQAYEGYQALTATYNNNHNGYLLIVSKGKVITPDNLNELLVFNVTSSGISLLNENLLDFGINYFGQVKVSNSVFSPKMCISNQTNFPSSDQYISRVYSFNRVNGSLGTNYILQINKSIISCEFSSSDNLLYASMDIVGNRNIDDYRLVVYDLTNISLGYRVLSNSPIAGNLQKAIDGNIYFTKKNDSEKLFKIENQNSWNSSFISSQVIDFGFGEQIVDLPQIVPSFPVNSCPSSLIFTTTELAPSATYQASNTIETNTNYLVNAGSTITLKAGNSITFSPSSEVKANSSSNFTAQIAACSPSARMVEELDKDLTEQRLIDELVVYPNPAKDNLTLEIRNDKINRILITTLEGKVVFEKLIEQTNLHQLDISSYQNGLYMLNVETIGGHRLNRKIIKN